MFAKWTQPSGQDARTEQPPPSGLPKNATPSMDEASVRMLLERFAFVEKPVDSPAPVPSLQMRTVQRGFIGDGPDPNNPGEFEFHADLMGNICPLSHGEIDIDREVEIPLSALLDRRVIEYYKERGAYQFVIVSSDNSFGTTPTIDASGVIFFAVRDQSVEQQHYTFAVGEEQNFKAKPAGSAIPIDSDLSQTFMTLKIDGYSLRTMQTAHANLNAYLSSDTVVRFDGYSFSRKQ